MDNVLITVFANAQRIKLLQFMLDNAISDFPVADLTRGTGLAYITVQKQLAELESIGLVWKTRKLKQQYWGISQFNPKYLAISAMMNRLKEME